MSDDWVIGVDLGGTKIETGLISPENRVVSRVRIPTNPALGPQSVVERIAREVETLSAMRPEGARIAALGLCAPGPVDNAAGMLLDPPNLAGLHYAPLQQMLSTRLGIPVQIDHDAKAACLGEFYYGAGRGERSMTYVITGTGVGSATIVNGQMVRGQNNTAGEVGTCAAGPQRAIFAPADRVDALRPSLPAHGWHAAIRGSFRPRNLTRPTTQPRCPPWTLSISRLQATSWRGR